MIEAVRRRLGIDPDVWLCRFAKRFFALGAAGGHHERQVVDRGPRITRLLHEPRTRPESPAARQSGNRRDGPDGRVFRLLQRPRCPSGTRRRAPARARARVSGSHQVSARHRITVTNETRQTRRTKIPAVDCGGEPRARGPRAHRVRERRQALRDAPRRAPRLARPALRSRVPHRRDRDAQPWIAVRSPRDRARDARSRQSAAQVAESSMAPHIIERLGESDADLRIVVETTTLDVRRTTRDRPRARRARRRLRRDDREQGADRVRVRGAPRAAATAGVAFCSKARSWTAYRCSASFAPRCRRSRSPASAA